MAGDGDWARAVLQTGYGHTTGVEGNTGTLFTVSVLPYGPGTITEAAILVYLSVLVILQASAGRLMCYWLVRLFCGSMQNIT